MLTETASRMLETLPAYYVGEPLIERIIQARANEIDRLDAQLDKLAVELRPGAATDDLGLLGVWEFILGLPVRPPDATVNQRRAKIDASLRKLDSGSSADVLATLQAAVASGLVTVLRDTPDPLRDTLQVPYDSDSYNAVQLFRIAQRVWPAHRSLLVSYSDGFLLDASPLDLSSL